MKVQRRQYTAEFKREAVRLVTEQGLSKAQVARDLGINDNLLARWQKQLATNGTQAFSGQGNAQDAELARLRREVAVLRQERELLKKVVTIFAQPGSLQP